MDETELRGSGIHVTFVEGVGDEVLLSSTVLVALFSAVIVLFRGWYVSREEGVGDDDHHSEVSSMTGSSAGDSQSELAAGDGSAHVTNRQQSSNQQQQQQTEGERLVQRESTRNLQHTANSDGSVCAICLDIFVLPIETNCGHLFCANCLLSYRNHSNTLRIMQCPMCRQTVTLLFECFTNTADVSHQTLSDVRSEIRHYNRRFSTATSGWLDYLRDIPTLFRHLWREFFSVGGLVLMFRIRVLMCVIAAIVYLLSPLDIIPELFLGLFGLLDDAFILVLLLMYVTAIYRRYVADRQ